MTKAYKKFWNGIDHDSSETIIYCALKAWFARPSNAVSKNEIFDALISKAFSPVVNKNKLINGQEPFGAVVGAIQNAKWPLTSNPRWDKEKNDNSIVFFGLSRKKAIEEIFNNDEKDFNDFVAFVHSFYGSLGSSSNQVRRFSKRYYSYLFVDKTLEPIYQTVQTAHVAMVVGQKMKKTLKADEIYFQVCGIPEMAADDLKKLLVDNGFKVETFYEPDIKKVTTVATHPVRSDKRKILTQFALLTFN